MVTKVKKIRNGPEIIKTKITGKTLYYLIDDRYSPNQQGYTLRNSNNVIKTFKTAKLAEGAYKRRYSKK